MRFKKLIKDINFENIKKNKIYQIKRLFKAQQQEQLNKKIHFFKDFGSKLKNKTEKEHFFLRLKL